MLTETDIHYLVGLLSLASNPDHVEVELGNQILDVATGTRRDVDVTVVVKNGSQTIVFKGIEVKKHSRKLDSTHVEQLACKLNDMPEMTERGIVSATGYTKPAIKKAHAHGIALFEICDWDFSKEYFRHFKSQFCQSIQTSLEWLEPPSVKPNPNETFGEADKVFLKNNPKVYFGKEEINEEASDLNSLLNNLKSHVQSKLYEILKDNANDDGSIKTASITVNISDAPYVKAPSGNIILKEALFIGRVKWVTTPMPTHYKILRKIGKDKPYAGCMVAELGNWGLTGVMVSQTNLSLRIIHVPIADRNKNKIFKQRIY